MSDTSERLAALIEEERAALLDGDLDRVAALLPEKEALVQTLLTEAEDADLVAPLQDGLRRNAVLFDHALEGLRQVVKRLGSLDGIRKTLETYDSLGRRTCLSGPAPSSVERRA